jgi:hypothetical protein
MSIEEQLNATTRFVILVSLLGFMLLNNYLIILLGIILVLLIAVLYKYNVKEGFEPLDNHEKAYASVKESISSNNPLNNVLMTDYVDNVNKKEVEAKYDETDEEAINNRVKSFVIENNHDNSDAYKLFDSLGNNMDFESSMRQFHINPSTTIPNNQKSFLDFCYSNLYSEKPLTVY